MNSPQTSSLGIHIPLHDYQYFLFLKDLFLFRYMYVTCIRVSKEARKSYQIPLELELEVVVNSQIWVHFKMLNHLSSPQILIISGNLLFFVGGEQGLLQSRLSQELTKLPRMILNF